MLRGFESGEEWDCGEIFSDFIVKKFWRLGICKLKISKYYF